MNTSDLKFDLKHLPEGVSINHKQFQVMEKLLNGHSYKTISHEENISLAAVKQYAHRLYKKLGVVNRTDAMIKFSLRQ